MTAVEVARNSSSYRVVAWYGVRRVVVVRNNSSHLEVALVSGYDVRGGVVVVVVTVEVCPK